MDEDRIVKGRGEKRNKQVSETMALGIWKLTQVGTIFMVMFEDLIIVEYFEDLQIYIFQNIIFKKRVSD